MSSELENASLSPSCAASADSAALTTAPLVTQNYPDLPVLENAFDDNSLSEQQLRAIDLLLAGNSLTDAADLAGVTRKTLYNWRRYDPAFAAELRWRRREVWADAVQHMRVLVAPAVRVLGEQLRCRLDVTRHRAASTVLRMTGARRALKLLASEEHNS